MRFYTHITFGILIGVIFLDLMAVPNKIWFLIFVVIGALLPDVDHPKSILGRYFKVFNWLFQHRGFFHSIFFLVLVGLFFYLFTNSWILTCAILIGMLSHLVIDTFTKEGIMFFNPVSSFRLRGFIKTGSPLENFLFVFFIFVAAIKYFLI
jgi:inner membrane protein